MVTPGHREAADIGIADGQIVQLGGAMTGTQELAADGLLAIPGGVDAHTHLVHRGLSDRLESPVWVDDFWSGSRAAIAGGITTIGNMTYPVLDETGAKETPGDAVAREMAGAAPEAAVDWFLHPILLHPAALSDGEVAALAEGGHASIKMFLADPDLAADEAALFAAASAAQAAGSVTLLHCEDGAMLRQAGETLIAEERGAVANFPDAARSPPRWPRSTRRSASAAAPARASTSCTCPRPPRLTAAAGPGRPACRSTSRPGRCTCTCGCREPYPRYVTRRYSLIMPPTRACLRTRYCSGSTGSGSGFSGAAAFSDR